MSIVLANRESTEYYKKMLKAAGSLSNLFSESPQPYLGYRLVENLFCKAYNAQNLSRTDCSVDASKEGIGYGIKTFLNKNGKGYEKVAEFNRGLDLFHGLGTEEMVKKVSELRNERINFTQRNYGLSSMVYHCVVRSAGKISVFEGNMDTVNIGDINNIDKKNNIIDFSDNLNKYKFNISKSTLFKQFIADRFLLDFDVRIIEDPFEALERLLGESARELVFSSIREEEHIFLPLYSTRGDIKKVPERSGLNQWNAAGRPRNPDEVYIPIPSWIHRDHPGFFPPRETSFNLLLPNGRTLPSKVCQDGSKALMSHSNLELGKWILRDVMNIPQNELLTYEKLESLGLDSVVIYKKDDHTFDIDFAKIGSYEEFAGEDVIDTSEEE